MREAIEEEKEESSRSLHENGHRSIEKLIKIEDGNQDWNESHSQSAHEYNTNMFRTTSLKKDLDTIAKTLEINKEIPANQQEGSAYDHELKEIKEDNKIHILNEFNDDIEILNDEEFSGFGLTQKPFMSLKKRKSSK